ncbi:hypothetical protein [uncultured Roseovarius sp.]|uniref:hypothetical protein n=1 Tax=uncultured Roseovarius sp. TaxID=293344 RepID=UPI002605C63A|nr:hypothetical protein [uncultured Roseovarius sp.]
MGILSDVYELTKHHQGAVSRMTQIHGCAFNGTVAYDDKFVYIHHGLDATQDQLMIALSLIE